MNFFQRTPFFRLLLALIGGILLYQFVNIPNIVIIISFIISILLIFIFFVIDSADKIYKYRWIFGFSVFLFLFTLGFWLCLEFEKKNTFSSLEQKAIFQVKLISAPIEKESSYQCKVKLLQKFDTLKTEIAYGNAIIYLQKDSTVKSLRIEDKILIFTEFKTPDGVQNPDGFDYARYLKRQGISATAYLASKNWKKTDEKTFFSLLRISDELRNKLLEIFRNFHISGDEFAVLAALTLGYTDDLQPDLLKSYSTTGAMHILSVSGLHVGIIFIVLNFLLKFLNKSKRKKYIKSTVIIIFLWIYAFITGLSPAVIRAALMFSFVVLAESIEQKSQIYNTIFISAFLMLLIRPNFLFDIGFQLSYIAVLSIVFFQPTISKIYTPKNKLARWIWNLFAVSIAAQFGTAPFTLYYFHQFPNFFLLTNLIAIPLSTIVIYLAIALLFLFKIPFLSSIIAFLLKWSLWTMNFLIAWIQNLPYSISNISLDFSQLLFTFIALIFIVTFFYYKKFSVLLVGFIALLVVNSTFFYKKYNSLSSNKIIVFSDSRIPLVNFIHQTHNYVFTTDTVRAEKIAGNFWRSNLISKPIFINNNINWFEDGFATFGGKRIYILTDNSLKNKVSSQKIVVDYLIISNKIKSKIESILSCVNPKTIIVDKSISSWYTNHIKEICVKNNIKYYSIAENGAFVLNLNP